MSKVLYKFYDLETITEEELNQLSLERNTYRVLLDKIKELEKDFIKLRQITFTKYNSNEWNNCLSYNDDILPIKNKLDKLLEEIE